MRRSKTLLDKNNDVIESPLFSKVSLTITASWEPWHDVTNAKVHRLLPGS